MGDQTPKLQPSALQLSGTYDRKQRQKMILAVLLLLVAMTIFVARDWHNLFGAGDSNTADFDSDTDGGSKAPRRAHKTAVPAPLPAPKTKAPAAATHAPEPAPAPPAVVNRKALPPLEIEVVAGDSHRPVQAGNSSVRVDTGSESASLSAPSVSAPSAANNAGERVKMSVDTTHVVERPVQPSYPMLARQMKVQGAVILQALIGVDGGIQDLKVLSGPAILASAAQEAVRQWRFKPYLQNGVPVETEAKITVNFTISTL